MSFDIFLLSVEAEENTFDRAIVERAFDGIGEPMDADVWGLRAPDGEWCFGVLYIDQTPRISGFSVNRPPNFPRFWDALFDVLRQTRTLLTWPAPGPGPTHCVAREDWKSFIPQGFTDDFGEPALITRGAEIPGLIEASG